MLEINVTKKERLLKAISLELPDRPPILGGWLCARNHVQELCGCTEKDYWADPFHWGLEAERILGSDGITGVTIPVRDSDFRAVEKSDIDRRSSYTTEDVLDVIDALPDPEKIKFDFDEDKAYMEFISEFKSRQTQCRDILWCPADWELMPRALCYHEFGYESSLTALALYPDRYKKWIRVKAELSRKKAHIYARAIRANIHPGIIFTGEDLCGQRGPLVSPDFLRSEHFPLIEYALEPLHEVGAKLILHLDGDWRLLIDEMIALGFAGVQGFQRECGMDIEWVAQKRSRSGDPLIIMGPMSVTTTLMGSVKDVKDEVARSIKACRDNASLIFFTSTSIGPDIPLKNIRAFWEAVGESTWN